MTNTTLLITAIMLVVILIQMVINISLADSKHMMKYIIDEKDKALIDQTELIDSLREEIAMRNYAIDDIREHRSHLIDELCNYRNAIDRLPKHLQNRIKMELDYD